MEHEKHLTTLPWSDYELLDSGETMKLERFGEIVVARPETQALWKKARPELWKSTHAEFRFGDKKGAWDHHKPVPESWEVRYENVRVRAMLTGFKHTGIFPEQQPNWDWVAKCVSILEKPNVLNLFGYTGVASIVAAKAGAFVTHADASKQSINWAKENAKLSGLEKDAIRWVLDDALAYAKRELRREAKYDGIILDPPAFGRGAKGEVWHIEKDLPELLETLKQLLSDKPGAFFLLNGYAAGYAPLSFVQAIKSVFGEISGESGELRIAEVGGGRAIPAGIYVRFVRE